MKQMYAVLALALVLVFVLGSSVPAGVLRGEDYDRPVDNTVPGEGGEDDDHPWGGDRVIGDPDGIVDDRYATTSTLTGYLVVDLLLRRLIVFSTSDEGSTGTTAIVEAESSSITTGYRRSTQTAATSSRVKSWKVARR